MPFRNGLNCNFECHNIVRRGKRLVITKINLMLRRRILMVGRLHLKSHFLQGHYHIASGILSEIQRPHIKISCLFMRNIRRHAIVIQMIQKEFTLRAHIKNIAFRFCFRYDFLQNVSGISFVAGALRMVYITDQPRHFPMLRPPRKNGKCTVIRIKIHITLINSHEPFYGRTVKHHLIFQRFLQMAGCDCQILHGSKQICKLQTYKFHILFLYQFQYIFLRVSAHLFRSFT